MNKYVLDTSALLAVIFEEPGSKKVEKHYENSVMPLVNFSEALTKLVDKGYELEHAEKYIYSVVPLIVPYTYEVAKKAAEIYPTTKKYGLSLGDRACIATAITGNYEILTADQAWANLTLPVKITMIR